jgi:hypothetical protein
MKMKIRRKRGRKGEKRKMRVKKETRKSYHTATFIIHKCYLDTLATGFK